ncbi:type VI secretion system tip protein VgrG [Pseudomonas coronafaciens pv. coronafaciens]|uniref:Type VI secretion system tip protein VgrG n=2 Tax=Pseudomonas coronafaciens TaxID=53409 RepID=A0AAE6UMB6_9PSED|nr:type VI secretion system tip protein VgrG [Pseudomonas coronafaciens pv. coronafaciens]
MCKDLQMPITLAIADCQADLRVIGFMGRDALNETYRFDIQLISSTEHPDILALLHRDAFLSYGRFGEGVHGQVCQISRIHDGACVSLYHLVLMPNLRKLALVQRRRIHQDVTAPQLIARLLSSPAVGTNACRFRLMSGFYPPRPMRVQYDETDLHVLYRLCEEEGIHFRFEHEPSGHVLVFSDDPASFPIQRAPIRFRHNGQTDAPEAALLHMAERLAMPPASHYQHQSRRTASPLSPGSPEEMSTPAANQPFVPATYSGSVSPQEALDRQHGIHNLERLRCERREVRGQTRLCALRSGEVVQVLEHPEPLFNDQWLLTEVTHSGRQLQVLRGADVNDTQAILKAVLNDPRAPAESRHASGNGYSNSFRAIPWAIPFRPSLRHPRPAATGDHIATLQRDSAQEQRPGFRSIRFDWQAALGHGSPTHSWPAAQAASDELYALPPGTSVLIRYLGNNPERPVICAALGPADAPSGCSLRLDGAAIAPVDSIRLASGEHLQITTHEGLILHDQMTTLHIVPQHILITAPNTTPITASVTNTSVSTPSAGHPALGDLRLTGQPGRDGEPLADRIWYIVRMDQPGLQHLPRVAAEDILFEGRTDERGHLGLDEEQCRRLADEYRQTPRALCIIHPGHCLPLHIWFEQSRGQGERGLIEINNP